jgi:hypothetical protein
MPGRVTLTTDTRLYRAFIWSTRKVLIFAELQHTTRKSVSTLTVPPGPDFIISAGSNGKFTVKFAEMPLTPLTVTL